jgi:2-oxoglutarate dehydrogenase E2 component (dihydrolipoamide succinyltransferase)
VNSEVAGTIVELLVEEDSTVTVGQEVAKVELGEGGSGGAKPESKPAASEKAKSKEEPKEAPKEQPKEEPKKAANQQPQPTSQPKVEPKPQPAPAKPSPPPAAPQKRQETSSKDGEEKKFALWTRDERRVSQNAPFGDAADACRLK